MLANLEGKVTMVTGAGQGIISQGKPGLPNDIANTMLFLASEEAGYITGQTIVVDGGFTLPESQAMMDGFYAQ